MQVTQCPKNWSHCQNAAKTKGSLAPFASRCRKKKAVLFSPHITICALETVDLLDSSRRVDLPVDKFNSRNHRRHRTLHVWRLSKSSVIVAEVVLRLMWLHFGLDTMLLDICSVGRTLATLWKAERLQSPMLDVLLESSTARSLLFDCSSHACTCQRLLRARNLNDTVGNQDFWLSARC